MSAWRREAAERGGAGVLGRLVVVAQAVQRPRDHLARARQVTAHSDARSLSRSLSRSFSSGALSSALSSAPSSTRSLARALSPHTHLVRREGGIRLRPFPEDATPSRLAGIRRKRPVEVVGGSLHPGARRAVCGGPCEDGHEHPVSHERKFRTNTARSAG